MAKRKKKYTLAEIIVHTILVFVCIGVLIAVLLQGTNIALLNPKGAIASDQYRLIKQTVYILLAVAIPTLSVFYFFAYKYRVTNKNNQNITPAHQGKFFVFSIWAIPIGVMLLLASNMWPATHKLAPQKQINSSAKPITIQVVAMRWKWLFIYPEQNIATVNFIQIPTNTPVVFELTADETPMSSFWIPQLGGQLYAMTGHVNQLNLMADTEGDYTGSSAEINGDGFAGMRFTVHAGSQYSFDKWISDTKMSNAQLSSSAYQKLLAPSQNNAVQQYAAVEPNLYANMLMKYTGLHNHGTEPK